MKLIDIFFPKFCIGCNKFGKYICGGCLNNIIFLNNTNCPVCNRPVVNNFTHSYCLGKTSVDGVIGVMEYNKTAKKIIKAVKYKLVFDIYTELYAIIKNSHMGLFDDFYKNHHKCYFQPIPLHVNRLKQRGFNQAKELADFFYKQFNYPIINSLIRIKDTFPQAQIISKAARQKNITGAFFIKTPINFSGSTIILIDDVYTTGSTCNEAAKIFKKHGALHVFVWALARD